MSFLGWTGPHYIQHGGQTREVFNKAMLSKSSWINSVLEGKNCTKIDQAMPQKCCQVCTSLGPVCGASPSPAIFPRLPNGSQPNFPGRQQMGWNRKHVVQTSEICRGVRLGAAEYILAICRAGLSN